MRSILTAAGQQVLTGASVTSGEGGHQIGEVHKSGMVAVSITNGRITAWQYVKCSNAIAANTEIVDSSGVPIGKIDTRLFNKLAKQHARAPVKALLSCAEGTLVPINAETSRTDCVAKPPGKGRNSKLRHNVLEYDMSS